jgi:hypothetical protein
MEKTDDDNVEDNSEEGVSKNVTEDEDGELGGVERTDSQYKLLMCG